MILKNCGINKLFSHILKRLGCNEYFRNRIHLLFDHYLNDTSLLWFDVDPSGK